MYPVMDTNKRRPRAVGALAALALGVGAVVASASAAGGSLGDGPVETGVKNPGEIVFELTGGLITVNNGAGEFSLGEPPDPDAEPTDPVTLTGTVDEFGNIHIPAGNVVFPEVFLPDQGVTVNIGASQDVTGHIDVWTGEMSANLPLAIAIDTGFLAVCTLNLPMQLSTANEGGVPYARNGKAAGTVTVADSSFAIPNTTPSGLLGPIACPQVNAAFGLPAPAGTNSAVVEFLGDPVLAVKVFPPGHKVMNQSRCEADGGVWANNEGVASCTTEDTVVEMTTTGFIQTGTSGTNRWRAQIRITTATLYAVTDSQQGNVGALGTSDTYEQGVEIVDQQTTYEVATCQQGGTFSSTWNNRALDSPRCVEILEDYIAGQS